MFVLESCQSQTSVCFREVPKANKCLFSTVVEGKQVFVFDSCRRQTRCLFSRGVKGEQVFFQRSVEAKIREFYLGKLSCIHVYMYTSLHKPVCMTIVYKAGKSCNAVACHRNPMHARINNALSNVSSYPIQKP